MLVFQHSWAKGILGFDYSGGVMAFMPVFLFVILFGLSMDYHVFILSRIREAYDRGMKTEDAVAHGIKTTAGVVTSAAIVMVFVFGIFATLSIVMLKQFGVGLAAAVLIDATIVRAVLLPAAMMLLGDWNWYLPRWLEWLPKLEHERSAEVRARARARARAREARSLSSTTSGVGSRTRPPAGPIGVGAWGLALAGPHAGVAGPAVYDLRRRRSSSAGQSTALVKRGPRVRIPSPACSAGAGPALRSPRGAHRHPEAPADGAELPRRSGAARDDRTHRRDRASGSERRVQPGPPARRGHRAGHAPRARAPRRRGRVRRRGRPVVDLDRAGARLRRHAGGELPRALPAAGQASRRRRDRLAGAVLVRRRRGSVPASPARGDRRRARRPASTACCPSRCPT